MHALEVDSEISKKYKETTWKLKGRFQVPEY